MRNDADGRHEHGHVHGMLQAHDEHDAGRHADDDDVRWYADDVLRDGLSPSTGIGSTGSPPHSHGAAFFLISILN